MNANFRINIDLNGNFVFISDQSFRKQFDDEHSVLKFVKCYPRLLSESNATEDQFE
jgi:hypothetical protein